MNINVSEIYNEITNLTALLDEYEKNYINLYKNYFDSAYYWKDQNSINFFNHLEMEKPKVKNTCDELNELKNIYEYIYDSYSKIGNKIYYNQEKKSELAKNLQISLDIINDIIAYYNNLNLELNSKEYILVSNELYKAQDLKNEFENMYNDLVHLMDNIDNIEAKTNEKISKINLEIIKESDINEFL